MSKKKIIKLGGILLILALAAGFWLTSDSERRSGITAGKEPHEGSGPMERKIKYWVAPMDPTYISEKPGKSPMGMDLVPVYEDAAGESDDGVIRIDPVVVQNMGVRTATAVKGPLISIIRAVGHVTYDEERVEHIHTKISGWIEKLFINSTGESVNKGEKLLAIYSPELVSTQEEYLQALKYRDRTAGSGFEDVTKGADTLLESTRKRLLLMDIGHDQIKALEERGKVQTNMILNSPASGVVIKKHVFEGMKVDPGMTLYIIADLSRVWVIASVYEYELPFLKVGQEAEITLSYEPGAKYKGLITFIYPYLSRKTRTAQVRIELDNTDLKLKPDMYADVVIKAKLGDNVLLVPSEAVIRTGSRNIVVTSIGDGKFLPREVTIGPEGEGVIQISSGLSEGETVVTSGQFLIDSESNLKEAVKKMLEARKKPAHEIMMTESQKNMMFELIDSYMNIHSALISESAQEAAEEAHTTAGIIKKIRVSDPDGKLKDITVPAEGSLDGLMSGDLKKARESFKILNKPIVMFTKGAGREHAILSGIKIFYCPMEDEHWIQKTADIKNPYMGEDMRMCGVEVEY